MVKGDEEMFEPTGRPMYTCNFWRLEAEFDGFFLTIVEVGIEEGDVRDRNALSKRLHPK